MFNFGFALAIFLESAQHAGRPVITYADYATVPVTYAVNYGEIADASGAGYVFYSDNNDVAAAIADGYDYISYADVLECGAHVGDIVCTLELIDDDWECVARYDYVDYCPHN